MNEWWIFLSARSVNGDSVAADFRGPLLCENIKSMIRQKGFEEGEMIQMQILGKSKYIYSIYWDFVGIVSEWCSFLNSSAWERR